MKSRRTRDFKKGFDKLPQRVQQAAYEKYKLFKENPYHERLDRKPIARLKSEGDFIEVTITHQYRAVALVEDETYSWIFIGSHSQFDKFVDQK